MQQKLAITILANDWDGEALTTNSDGRVVVTGDDRLHAEVLKLLG